MKNRLPQILFILGGLFLLSLFSLPLWRITLQAPQYPEGVDMYIYINKIGGSEPCTLQNVNILNHYIGMKPIEPDSIPELKILPKIILAFSASAFIFVLFRNKYLYALWVMLFSVACMAGLYDFYLWEYDYGHNLADNAPMKFEGESFQPPLIGNKKIINFIAKSWPHSGGYMAIFSLLFATLATYLKFKKS